jgi:hypothetical protein
MANPRVDEAGLAYKGSQRQVQTWVNDNAADLNEAILAGLPDLAAVEPQITWRSPLRTDGYREYADAAFLERIGHAELSAQLAEFWPAGGPVWDALATYGAPAHGAGVILVEGKSYPDELYGPGCKAGQAGSAASRRSRIKIAAALRQTQTWLEMGEMPDWLGSLYQSANRLAHAYWLREQARIDTWLVHLLFESDPIQPTTGEQWTEALEQADKLLGLAQPLPWHASVILKARD